MNTPITVAVSGASGLIGSALVARFRAKGYTVRRMVRAERELQPGDVFWNPMGEALDPRALEGCDAIVNLAGEPIAQHWSDQGKRAIRDSRLRGTALIANAVASMASKPAVVLSGSAVGYYGDRGDESLDEDSSVGTDFLAHVARDWEDSAAPIAAAGVRLVLLRTGIVLTPKGGALGKLLLPFRLGLGGPIGDGRQWMSWISLEDCVRAVEHALGADTLHGPANLVAPSAVQNATFATTLGRVLRRPAFVPVPRFALQLALGEMAEATLLASQRAIPRALQASKFEFTHVTLEAALRAELRSTV